MNVPEPTAIYKLHELSISIYLEHESTARNLAHPNALPSTLHLAVAPLLIAFVHHNPRMDLSVVTLMLPYPR